MRALLPGGARAVSAGHGVLARCDLVRVNDAILNEAGVMMPMDLRSPDAVHLTTVLRLGGDVSALVTYDERMAMAAGQLGVRVAAPA